MQREKKRGMKSKKGHAHGARGHGTGRARAPAPRAEAARPLEVLAKRLEVTKLPEVVAQPIEETTSLPEMASRPNELVAKLPFEAAPRLEEVQMPSLPRGARGSWRETAIGVAVFVVGTACTFGVMRKCASDGSPAGEVDASTVEAPSASSGELASVEG